MNSDFYKKFIEWRKYANSLEGLSIIQKDNSVTFSKYVEYINIWRTDGQLPMQCDFWNKKKCFPKSEFQFFNMCEVLFCLGGKSYLPANALTYFHFSDSLVPVT